MATPSFHERLFQAHLAQLRRLVERQGVAGVRELYEEAKRDLAARLRALGPANETATQTQLRAMIAQAEAVLEEVANRLETKLDDLSTLATTMGGRHGIDEYKRLERHFTGTTPVLDIERASIFRGMVSDIDQSLLRRHRLQTRTWSAGAIANMERTLSVGTMAGKPLFDVVSDIVKSGGMLDEERWKAERIARTEGMYAHGAVKHKALERANETVGKGQLMKRLVETFDDRTGDDSFVLHGQLVPVSQPFEWKHKKGGRWVVDQYMHPPNRPNDRAVVIPWDPTWDLTKEERPLSDSELRSAPKTRWRGKAGVPIPPDHKPGLPYSGSARKASIDAEREAIEYEEESQRLEKEGLERERKEAEEKAQREAEERLRREAEERKKAEAEERAPAEADREAELARQIEEYRRMEAEQAKVSAARERKDAKRARLGKVDLLQRMKRGLEPNGTPTAKVSKAWFLPTYKDPDVKGIAPTGRYSETKLLKAAQNPESETAQKMVRRQMNELLARYRLVDRELAAGEDDIGLFSKAGANLPERGSAQYHGTTGQIVVSDRTYDRIRRFGQGDRDPDAQKGMLTALHEAAHSASPGATAAHALGAPAGRMAEEVTTEIVARRIFRQQFPGVEKTTALRQGEGAVRLGGYQKAIDGIAGVVRETLLSPAEAGEADPEDPSISRLEGILERASFLVKRGVGRDVGDQSAMLDRFAEALMEAAGLETDSRAGKAMVGIVRRGVEAAHRDLARDDPSFWGS